MSEGDGEGHQVGALVRGIAEHDTLVTSTVVLEIAVVKTLGDIGRLLLDGDEHVAGVVVKALLRGIVADVLDGVTDDLLVVNGGLGGDLAEDHDLLDVQKTPPGGKSRWSALLLFWLLRKKREKRAGRHTHHAGLGGSLTGDLGPGVLGQAGTTERGDISVNGVPNLILASVDPALGTNSRMASET